MVLFYPNHCKNAVGAPRGCSGCGAVSLGSQDCGQSNNLERSPYFYKGLAFSDTFVLAVATEYFETVILYY